MTKEQEKAIYRLNIHKNCAQISNGCCVVNAKDIEKVLSILEENDRTIQNMSKYILSLDIDKDICMKNTTNTELCNKDNSNCVECIIKHFSN